MHAPIVTFLTDFGLQDAYVAEMKAAALRHCPDARLIDITHLIAPHDVLAGSIALERALRAFEPGTIHVAVVDPGVGSQRKLIVAHLNGQTVLCPDNGLITWPLRRIGKTATLELLWRPADPSSTFHGRDVLAPAAGLLASGRGESLAVARLDQPVLLDLAPARSLDDACVIHVDHFGNVTTNVPADLLTDTSYVREIGRLRQTYSDVEIGEPLALVGSSGLLEIAVRNGNAASQLDLAVGSKIKFRS